MAVNLSPVAGAAAQFFDNSGNVLTGGKLYTYDAGTTTPAPTYTTSSGVTAQPNPIVLDAAGRVPDSGEIWLSDSVSYKFVLKDSNDVLIGTYDNLVGINSNFVNFTGEEETQTATQGQTVFTLTTIEYQPATNNLLVFINGSKQISGSNYQETSSTVVTFVDGLNVGDVVDFCTATPINTNVVTADQVNYNEGDAGAVDQTVEAKLQQYISVKDFGATGDGITDDTDAIQNCIDAVVTNGGGAIYVPEGTYKITSALVIDSASYTIGVSLFGIGRNSIISQTGTDEDAIKWSTTQYLQNSFIRDLQIVCDTDAGHCINVVYGCTANYFDNVELVQNNPAKACIYGDWSVSGGGMYDTKFRGGSWYCNPASTEAGFRIKTNETIFNENVFENLRCYQSASIQFFHIAAVAGSSYWLYNNTWKNINFEICKGGGFYFSSANRYTVENCSFWDAGGAYVNNLIDFVAGSGYESVANTIINTGRNGDTLGAFVNDIRIVSGQDTILINCYTQTSDAPVYNFTNKRVTIIGKLFGTLNNAANTLVVNAIDGIRFTNTVNGTSLNYYDEGTWTAVLTGSGTSPTIPVSTTGIWTRIGRQVTVSVNFANVTTTGASGNVVVTGLPFTPNATYSSFGSVAPTGFGSIPLVVKSDLGGTQVYFYNAATFNQLTYSAGTGQYLSFTLTYTV